MFMKMLRSNLFMITCRKSILQQYHRYGDVKRTIVQQLNQNRGMSSTRRLDISGIYPPIATPFDKEEKIDYGKLHFNLQKWNEIDFRGYVVQGSNGEYAYLTPEERVGMVKKVRELAPKHKQILAGSGCESTRDTVTMTAQMADAGADAVLVVTPCFYKGGMTNAALERHFTRVADSSPVPVILYSVPSNTTIDLSPDVIVSLADHPNIIGLKDSGGDISKLAGLVFRTQGKDFQVVAGSASYLYPALVVGCVGGVCGLANVLGEECCELQTLYTEGRHSEAQALQHRLVAPNIGVTRRFGIPGLKQAMDWFGYYGGRTREPLQPLTKSEQSQLREMFTTSGFTVR